MQTVKRYLVFFTILSLFPAWLMAKPLPFNQHMKQQASALQRWHLEGADILSVIAQVSEMTGKNFIIDPRVEGKVTVIANQPMSKDEIYQVFLSAIQTMGYAAVPSDQAIKIVPSRDANTLGTTLASASNPGKGAELVVRVVNVKNAVSTQMIPVLRPLLPQNAHISAYSQSNSLIIAGRADNINRLVGIIAQVDKAAENKADIITLHNADATQIASVLNQMQNHDRTLGGPKAVVIADERTNRLVLSGDKIARMHMRVLITQLDGVADDHSYGNTEVIPLRYLNATAFAPKLAKIAHGDVATQSKEGDSQKITVEAEIDTNSVLVSAPHSVIKRLKRVVKRLDVRPAQVLVEALIVEISDNDTNKFGIEWSINGEGESPGSDLRGFIPGFGILRKGRFSALVAALKGMSDANVLSTPSVVVMNNKKASFNVGKQVSIQTTASGPLGATAAGVPFTTSTFTQQDVGLSLIVTPQINRDDAVLLTVEQHDGSLQNPENPTTTPIINKSDIATTVMINSGDTLVLGGLISNDLTNSVNKTPVLGDIPLLGELFTYRDKRLERKKLMVFIHPVILHTPLDGTRVSSSKYKYIRDLELDMTNPWRNRRDNPHERVLPPTHNSLELPEPFE